MDACGANKVIGIIPINRDFIQNTQLSGRNGLYAIHFYLSIYFNLLIEHDFNRGPKCLNKQKISFNVFQTPV